MASLQPLIKHLASVMAFTVAVSSCFLLAVVFYNMCSWSATCDPSLQFSENKRSGIVPRIFKRTADPGNRFHYYDNCVLAEPSREDIHKLCAHQECSTVHCVRSCPCGDNRCRISSRTTCFTKACKTFRVKVGQAENEVSLESFSDIVNDYLSGFEDTKKIEVTCSDNNSHVLGRQLGLEITRNDLNGCTLDGVVQSKNIKTTPEFPQLNRTKIDVYLIYFRLMSKWESFVKLPRLNSFIEHKRNDVFWNLYSFDNVQSHSFVLDENLREVLGFSSLLGGVEKMASFKEDDLIQLAIKDGNCVFFHALACHKSRVYSKIQDAVNAGNAGQCHLHENKHHETRLNVDYNNHTFCDDKKMDMDMEDILFIHDRIGQIYSTSETSSFSVFVINIPDLKSTEAFDTAVTELVTRVLSQAANTLILMSDVGDPKFSRLDESVFLRTQMFNPLLHVFISTSATLKDPATSLLISEMNMKVPKSTIGISSVNTLIQTILNRNKVMTATKHLGMFQTSNGTTRDIDKDETVNTVCPLPKVGARVECVCEGKHTRFVNDSIQLAFACYILGNVNNKLHELTSLSNFRSERKFSHGANLTVRHSLKNRFKCDRLHGVYVTNINHVLWRRSTFVLMTLYLRQTSRPYSPTIRLEAEVEYSTDDTYNTNFTVNILHPTKIPLTDFSAATNKNSRKLLHLLCHDPNDLIRDSHGQFLHMVSSEINFGVKPKAKSLHYPCLYLLTRDYGHSVVLEATNVCTDRSYHLSVSIDHVNMLALGGVPGEVKVGARHVRHVATLVKIGYWLPSSGYRVHTSYVVSEV